jgi:FkbH-like protein
MALSNTDTDGALAGHLEAALAGEQPAPELALKVSRGYERLGRYGDAYSWLARVAEAGDTFTAWNGAAATLRRLRAVEAPPTRARCQVALTGSYTLSQLAAMLPVAGLRLGIDITVHEGLYGQYRQDLLDPGSMLYGARPDIVVLGSHEGAAELPSFSPDPAASVGAELARWHALWEAVGRHSEAAIVQHGFAVRPESPYGHLSAVEPGTRYAMLHALNVALARSLPAHVSFLDCDRLAANFGRERWFDERYWFRAKQAVALDAIPLLARHTAAVIAGRLGLARKCLVLDLDNTLWGGVVGEDGLAGIKLGGDGDGEAFVAFQEYILGLKERGVILAVASKNNEADALEVFDHHPEMRLRREDIAMFAVSWEDKAASLRRIAEGLNIGLDSLVLVDDSPAERQIVRTLLPEVDVISLPTQPGHYRRALAGYLGFESAAVTAEDRARTTQYRARAEAARLASASADLDGFLRDLRMEAVLAPFDELNLPRIAQLCGKTNQFNLTTRRHTAVELARFAASPSHLTRYLKLSDRLADHGLVALLIAECGEEALEIETFLMSCRVIGRTVEGLLLADLCAAAERLGQTMLRGTFRPTAKNAIVVDLYARFGFTCVHEDGSGATVWEYDLAEQGPILNDVIRVRER